MRPPMSTLDGPPLAELDAMAGGVWWWKREEGRRGRVGRGAKPRVLASRSPANSAESNMSERPRTRLLSASSSQSRAVSVSATWSSSSSPPRAAMASSTFPTQVISASAPYALKEVSPASPASRRRRRQALD
jgi:hypothetical protein